MGHQRHAQDLRSDLAYFVKRTRKLHTSALASTAGMNLRLYHPHASTDLLCRLHSFIHRKGHLAPGHSNIERAKNFFCLIFVNLHENSLMINM